MTATPNQDDEAKTILSMRSDERGALSSEALAMLQRGADAMVRADEAFEKAWAERRRKTWTEAGRDGEPNIDWSEGFKRPFREGWQAALAAQPQAAPQPEAAARALELADDLERWGRNAARDELVKLQPNMVIEMARRIRAALSAAPHPTGGKP